MRKTILAALGALALALFVFAPRLWLIRARAPESFQWSRATTYLKQCEAPLRRDIEPAMLWRLGPPVVAHALGLRGLAPLALPWLGVAALCGYVAVLAARRSADGRLVFGAVLLVTASEAVLTPAHWLGLNDAWAWLGLLAVAFGRAGWALPAAVLLAPWVDERFIIGLPLALLVRANDRGEAPAWRHLGPLLWLLPYAAARIAFSGDAAVAEPTRSFLGTHLRQIAIIGPWAPLAWWMAWRGGWLPIVYACTPRRRLLGAATAATLGVTVALAADMSRSAAVLAPVMLFGVFEYARRAPERAPRHVLALALLNLALPAAHVTFTKFDLVNPLPLELWRLLR
jgi:hypothetical protein